MHSIEWAAGLFEGEGCIYKRKHGASLKLEMTDKDVIEMFEEVFPGGKWSDRQRGTSKRIYAYNIHKKNFVIHALSKMLPYFGNRRAYKALNVLDDLELA
jgi:hypothetical protein